MTIRIPGGSGLTCAACYATKDEDEFSVDTTRARGRKYSCKSCCAKRAAASYQARPAHHRALVKKSREKNLAKALISGARKRALAKGVPFDLDRHLDDIRDRIDTGFCELTGLPFQIGNGHHWASPSIDRIVAAGPYIHSNIRIILHGYNNALGNWGEEVLFAMIDARRAAK